MRKISRVDQPGAFTNMIYKLFVLKEIRLKIHKTEVWIAKQSIEALITSILNVLLIGSAISFNYLKVDVRISLMFLSIFYIVLLYKMFKSVYSCVQYLYTKFNKCSINFKEIMRVYFSVLKETWNFKKASITAINMFIKENSKDDRGTKKLFELKVIRVIMGKISIKSYDELIKQFRERISPKLIPLIFNTIFYTGLFFVIRSFVFNNVYGISPVLLILEPIKIIISQIN